MLALFRLDHFDLILYRLNKTKKVLREYTLMVLVIFIFFLIEKKLFFLLFQCLFNNFSLTNLKPFGMKQYLDLDSRKILPINKVSGKTLPGQFLAQLMT